MHWPRHMVPATRHDAALGRWVALVGLFLLAPAVGAALAGPYLSVAP